MACVEDGKTAKLISRYGVMELSVPKGIHPALICSGTGLQPNGMPLGPAIRATFCHRANGGGDLPLQTVCLLESDWQILPPRRGDHPMSRSQLASVVSGIALGAWILAVVAGCAARETFLTPKDLSADLRPEKAERIDDAEKLTDATVRNPIRLASGHAGDIDEPDPLILPSPQPSQFVIVSGDVRQPGEYPFPEGRDFRVLEAVARAEGIQNKVIDTIVVCRKQKDRDDRVLIRVSLRKATRNESENIRLMPGDIVSIEPTVTTLMKDSAGYVGAAAAGGGMLLIGGGPH